MVHIKERQLLIVFILFLLGGVFSCKMDLPEPVALASQQLPEKIDFNFHVKPILSDKCYFCHGPDLANQKAGLSLHTEEEAFNLLENSGKRAIVPGKPGHSEVVHRILSDQAEIQMPPPASNLPLTDYEKALLIKWIEQGANYKKHWAYLVPQKVVPPTVNSQTPLVNAIDSFIVQRLKQDGFALQAEADKETLLRRLSFDLTGLPPSVEELDAFLADNSPEAYEKAVDRLLASPHYGEKMATNWMDVARYADTHGYSVDRYRPMWPWRDWVIKAFNENQGYDEFITWQLAGDLLPNATKEQKLATAFNRNHAQNMEGGIVNEEFRIEYVADRTNTFGKAMLAHTMECARCHDHKFDPVSQKEYFQLFSFFNQVDEAGQISWDDAMPVPTMLLTDERQDSIIEYLQKAIHQKEQEVDALSKQPSAVLTSYQPPVKYQRYLEKGLQAHFDFDRTLKHQFINRVNPSQKASITEAQSWKQTVLEPQLTPAKFAQGVILNGDDPLDLGQIGIFSRAQSFSIGIWVKIPEELENGVIFHKGQGAILYSFRGYHLAIRDNKLEALMAHTWPYNNIIKLSEKEIPKDRWVQLTLTYDGSSTAQGLQLYMDGEKVSMLVEKDNLYKDILFPALDKEPGLRIGARWRGTGIKGAQVDEIRVYSRALLPSEIHLLTDKKASLDATQERQLEIVHQSVTYQQKQQELLALRLSLNEMLDSIPEIMVIDELKTRRKTHLLERGAYDAPGEEVFEGTPTHILPFSDALPRNRLGLAQWLFSPNNPLTARVIVNRYWQSYFGRGIIKSAADFGNQGDLPTHPALLDWLAVEFMESGWNIKAMQKLIVMSATYRQSSKTSPKLLENDYDNALLTRGPSDRLSAEELRDNALFASGLMVPKIGGESVKPYQPTGLWRFNGTTYVPDQGEKLYRRSLYTFWKRTVPPPTMNTFDAPSRSYCVVKRQKTTTPLQSLALLNDPQFIEAGRALAAKAMIYRRDTKERLSYLYRSLTAQKPKSKALAILLSYYEDQKQDLAQHPEKVDGWLAIGEYKGQPDFDRHDLAAYAIVSSMIMNSSAATNKR
ncbi:MAG: DUF1553 domain-containing protein [Saprospiraceae bacterium]|nr:DUF1553 domain-containing protein [Saprospiraceae bacterium]